MKSARIWLAATLVAMAMPSTAAAADDFRAGEQEDPQADASLVYPDYGGSPSRLLDVRKVRVEYDAGIGSLAVHFNGSMNGVGHAGLSLHANLTAPNAGGTCDGKLRAGDLQIEGLEVARFYIGFEERAILRDHDGAELAPSRYEGSYQNEDATGNGPRMTFSSPSLIRRNLRCVSGVYASKAESGWQQSSRDDVKAFCLAQCPTLPATEAPKLRATGSTLSWNRIGSVNSYVVATSAAPEGSAGRNTTYRTVTGTSFTPPAVPGATRYYGVRADVADSLWANPEARISYPIAPAPTTGGQGDPIVTAPGSTQGSGVNQGIIITNSNVNAQNQTTTVLVSLTLTAAKARGVARKALAFRYGKAFSRRAKRSYKVACAPDDAKAVCKVQWRYKRSRYKGKITITRTQQGDVWRTAITRKISRRS